MRTPLDPDLRLKSNMNVFLILLNKNNIRGLDSTNQRDENKGNLERSLGEAHRVHFNIDIMIQDFLDIWGVWKPCHVSGKFCNSSYKYSFS